MAMISPTPLMKMGVMNRVVFGGSLPSGVIQNTTGSTTITYVNGRLRAAGGSGSTTNNSENLILPGVFSGNNWNQTLIFKPISTGTGFSLGLASSSGVVTAMTRIRFNIASGVLTLENDGGVLQTSGALTYTLGTDILIMKHSRNKFDDTETISVGKYNSTSAPVTLTYSAVSSMVQQTSISFHGGTTDFYECYVDSFSHKCPKILVLGDSNSFGVGNTSYDLGTYYTLIKNTNSQIAMMGGPSAKIEDISAALSLYTALQPENIYLMIGTNNRTESSAVFLPKYQALITALSAISSVRNITMLSVYPTSANTNIPTFNTGIQALANGTNKFYIDLNTPLNDGSGNLSATYNSGDNLHTNNAWSLVMTGLLQSSFTRDLAS